MIAKCEGTWALFGMTARFWASMARFWAPRAEVLDAKLPRRAAPKFSGVGRPTSQALDAHITGVGRPCVVGVGRPFSWDVGLPSPLLEWRPTTLLGVYQIPLDVQQSHWASTEVVGRPMELAGRPSAALGAQHRPPFLLMSYYGHLCSYYDDLYLL